MPRYELWSERECGPDKLHRVHEGSLEESKAMFETLISRWGAEIDEWFLLNRVGQKDEEPFFTSKILPGAEEGCIFVLKDEHGKSLFVHTHEWEVERKKI